MQKTDYWFKRRRYGYGWVPSTWQGWATVFGFVVVLIGAAAWFEVRGWSTAQDAAYFSLIVLAAAGLLVWISYQKGPKPRWRWGWQEGDTPEEDF